MTPDQRAALLELAKRVSYNDAQVESVLAALARTGGEVCHVCKGTGRDPMSDNVNWLPCNSCNGTGKQK